MSALPDERRNVFLSPHRASTGPPGVSQSKLEISSMVCLVSSQKALMVILRRLSAVLLHMRSRALHTPSPPFTANPAQDTDIVSFL